MADVFIRHDGPEFDNLTFNSFAADWQFEHITPNAVKTCKRLLMKAKEEKRDPLLGIFNWRNAPSEGSDSAPLQFKGLWFVTPVVFYQLL